MTIIAIHIHYFYIRKETCLLPCKNKPRLSRTKKELSIVSIGNNNDGKFQNSKFEVFCNENDIQHTFPTPLTTQ